MKMTVGHVLHARGHRPKCARGLELLSRAAIAFGGSRGQAMPTSVWSFGRRIPLAMFKRDFTRSRWNSVTVAM